MQIDDLNPNRRPVDRVAARVVHQPGFAYSPKKKVLTREDINPFPVKPIPEINKHQPHFHDLTGRRFGRFLVLGLARDFSKRWVVRCACGRYAMRTSKAIRNPKNTTDRCEHCRHLTYLHRTHDIYGERYARR